MSDPAIPVMLAGEDLASARKVATWAVVDAVEALGQDGAANWGMIGALEALRTRLELLHELRGTEVPPRQPDEVFTTPRWRMLLMAAAVELLTRLERGDGFVSPIASSDDAYRALRLLGWPAEPAGRAPGTMGVASPQVPA